MKKRVCATLAAALITVSGCGGDDKENNAGSGSPNLPPPTTTEPLPSTPANPTGGRVPRALQAAESSAEDLIDFARAKKRAKVVAEANRLRSLAQGDTEAALSKAKVPEVAITALNDRAQSVALLAGSAEFSQLALAANQVSGLMPLLYSYFSDPVPPEVLKLDYLDREAQLRSIENDQALTQRAVNQLPATWKKLQPEVAKAGGDRETARYSRHVERMRTLVESFDRRAIRKEAGSGLRLVDQIEKVFRRR